MLICDCSCRDGGYNNDWRYDLDLANKYLHVMEEAKVNAVEIGFRSPLDKTVGPFAKATDTFIEDNLYIPDVEYFGVMVNAASMNSEQIKILFTYADKSPINLVRIAIHFKDIDIGEQICKDLKNLGYFVTCNLMQAADKSYDEIAKTSEKVFNWNSADVLYLADSLGGMNQDDIDYSYKAIGEGWNWLTGYHGHNNKGQALDNSLEAVDIGVDWVDGTMLGMGRGPGNTETEYLLTELNKRGFGEFELEPVYELALNYFLPLKNKYKWGPSLLYYLSAEYNIHPTFIQTMLSQSYSEDSVLKVIYFLKTKDARFFNKKTLEEIIEWIL